MPLVNATFTANVLSGVVPFTVALTNTTAASQIQSGVFWIISGVLASEAGKVPYYSGLAMGVSCSGYGISSLTGLSKSMTTSGYYNVTLQIMASGDLYWTTRSGYIVGCNPTVSSFTVATAKDGLLTAPMVGNLPFTAYCANTSWEDPENPLSGYYYHVTHPIVGERVFTDENPVIPLTAVGEHVIYMAALDKLNSNDTSDSTTITIKAPAVAGVAARRKRRNLRNQLRYSQLNLRRQDA